MRTPITQAGRWPRPGAWLSLIALALMLSACTNPFTPAIPEQPDPNPIEEKFGTIQELLETMATGIRTKSPNGADAYIHAFAESTSSSQRAFRGFHDQTVKAIWLSGSNGQGATEPWLLDNERRLHSQLLGIRQNSDYDFQWDEEGGSFDDETPPGSGVWSVHRHYELKAVSGTGDAETIAAGFADLLLFDDGTRFSVIEWRDRVDPAFSGPPPVCFTWWRLESQ